MSDIERMAEITIEQLRLGRAAKDAERAFDVVTEDLQERKDFDAAVEKYQTFMVDPEGPVQQFTSSLTESPPIQLQRDAAKLAQDRLADDHYNEYFEKVFAEFDAYEEQEAKVAEFMKRIDGGEGSLVDLLGEPIEATATGVPVDASQN